MGRGDARKIKDEASAHVDKGRWRKALECYRSLERLEPAEGTWPQHCGDMHRRLGQAAESADAFTRAADAYSRQGFLLRAVAVCKLVLEIDPSRTDVEERLAALHAARLATQRRAGFIPVVAETPPEAPLASMPLSRVVPGARKSDQMPARPDSAVYEIPLADDQHSAAETARALFPKTPLFSSLDAEKLRLLIKKVVLKRLRAGETLFRRGDPADALYVITAGEVVILGAAPGGEEVEVGRLRDGDFFGEIAILVDQPRGATISATVDTDVLVIDRATISALIADAPDVLQTLLRFMRDRLIDMLVATNPMFAPFSGEDRLNLARRFVFLEAEAGSVLIEEGTRVAGLLVVLAGQVAVLHAGETVDEMGAGGIFGEVSLLSGAPAMATVVARGKVLLLALLRNDFQEVIMTHPQVLEHLATVAEDRRRRAQLWKQV